MAFPYYLTHHPLFQTSIGKPLYHGIPAEPSNKALLPKYTFLDYTGPQSAFARFLPNYCHPACLDVKMLPKMVNVGLL